ncbi:MAG TPA: hypothetical protein VLX58_22290 [Bryobacteraceae bacterium]|nr:hypothetical protein [Bryobacteraceae bacterium]
MPALLILAVISWLLGSGKTGPKGNEPPLFTALDLRPRRRWGAFAVSVVTHAFCVILLFIVSDIFSASDDDLLPRQFVSRALVIRLPDRIYLAPATGRTFPSTAKVARGVRVSIRHRDLRKYAERGTEAKAVQAPAAETPEAQPSLFSMKMAPPVEPAQADTRKFELPDLPVHDAAQTLLQAELPPDLPLQMDTPLPQLLFWDADTRDPKTPAPEHAIQPGNRIARLEPPKMNSTPRLELPNRQPVTSDFRADATPENPRATLTLPPSTTVPLRILEKSNEPSGPSSIDPFTGQPVHILALSPDPAPLSDAFKSLFIPVGNQLARLPGVPPFFGLPGFGDGSGSAAGGPLADAGARDGGEGGTGEPGPADLIHSLPGDGRIFGMLTPPGLTGTPLRVLHPTNGVFDVVVVQSSGTEAFPEASAALSGRPIYTVYLQVGAPKEWILQYCVPNMTGPVQTGNFVNLGNPAPVASPYPMVTVRPPEDWQHGSDYLLVHGFLDESGRFRDMSILATQLSPAPTTSALLQYLAYWEFRPALVDGRPAKVEVILAVPPDRVS